MPSSTFRSVESEQVIGKSLARQRFDEVHRTVAESLRQRILSNGNLNFALWPLCEILRLGTERSAFKKSFAGNCVTNAIWTRWISASTT
jgi:hypothetical protein